MNKTVMSKFQLDLIAPGAVAPVTPDKMEEVEGTAHSIFLVSDLKNKSIKVPFTPSTSNGQSDDSAGGQS